MSGTEDRNGKREEGYEVGRGAAGRRKILALIVAVILGAFVVLLVIWLLGSGSDSSEGAPSAPVESVEALAASA